MNKEVAQYIIVRLSQELHIDEKDVKKAMKRITAEIKKIKKVGV